MLDISLYKSFQIEKKTLLLSLLQVVRLSK